MARASKTIQVGSGICRAFVRIPIATGTADEVRKRAAVYEGILDRIILHGGNEDNKRAVMETFGTV